MSTLSVPLTSELEHAITLLLQRGFASNKAEIARKSILQALEEDAISVVLESEQQAREGKLLTGDLRELVRQTSL